MQSVLRTRQCKWQEGLQILLLLGLSGLGLNSAASEWCALSFQSAERGEWAISHAASEQFVFRTQRKQLEPPAIKDIATYYDLAEDAALAALEVYASRNLPGADKGASLQVSRSQAQRIRCDNTAWTVFSYNLAHIGWKKAATVATKTPAPSAQALPLPVNATPTPLASPASPAAMVPAPRKTEPRTLTTVEE